MASAAQSARVGRPPFGLFAIVTALPCLLFIFRTTAAAVLLLFILLYLLFPLHRSTRILEMTYAVFLAAILIPVDVYIHGFNGPIYGSQHSGLRFVHVVHGMPRIQYCLDKYGEFIADGCLIGLHDPHWRLVWD
jgi:hypothetical protein